MLKKLFLIGLMSFPSICFAQSHYPIYIPHIVTKNQAPPSVSMAIVPAKTPVYPILSMQDQELVKHALDLHSIKPPQFWVNIKGLNKSNIFDFVYNMRLIKDKYLESNLDGKDIRIPVEKVFVKSYYEKHVNRPIEECPGIPKNNDFSYFSRCEVVNLESNGYQEYIVPMGYSLNKANNWLEISITKRKISTNGLFVLPDDQLMVNFLKGRIKIEIQYNQNISQLDLKSWLNKNEIKYSFNKTYNSYYNNDSFYASYYKLNYGIFFERIIGEKQDAE